MVIGAVLYSCQDPIEQPVEQGKLVDVVFKAQKQEFVEGEQATRLHVTPAGITSWSPGDDVTIIDQGEGFYGQRFLYTMETTAVQGNFAGRLLAGMGTQTYYAYHKAPEAVGFSQVGRVITLGRKDIDIDQGSQDIRQIYGDYSTMVAVPNVFDAESGGTKYLEFHHANCLIEASISSKQSDGRIADLLFDAIELTVEATDGTLPFNTEVKFDLTQIVDPTPDNNIDDIVIPFIETGAEKVSTMSTRITYDAARHIGEFEGLGTNGTFGVAIVALPTTTTFEWVATVNFYNGDELVGRLQRPSRDGSPARGLRVSGLNVIDFTEDQWVDVDPLLGDGDGGGKDKDKDKDGEGDDDDQGEDNDDQGDDDDDDQGENNNDQ